MRYFDVVESPKTADRHLKTEDLNKTYFEFSRDMILL